MECTDFRQALFMGYSLHQLIAVLVSDICANKTLFFLIYYISVELIWWLSLMSIFFGWFNRANIGIINTCWHFFKYIIFVKCANKINNFEPIKEIGRSILYYLIQRHIMYLCKWHQLSNPLNIVDLQTLISSHITRHCTLACSSIAAPHSSGGHSVAVCYTD